MMFAQESSDAGEPFVVLPAQNGMSVLFRGDLHRAEFVERERPASVSDPLLFEYGRTSVFVFDQQIDGCKRGRKYDQSQYAAEQVERTFGESSPLCHLASVAAIAGGQAYVNGLDDEFCRITSHNDIVLNNSRSSVFLKTTCCSAPGPPTHSVGMPLHPP